MRLFVSLLILLLAFPALALEKVALQLNWKHQFQFAGYYAAIEQGYFRAAGFDVSLRELAEGHDPIREVLDGHADFGVAASELALQRGRGQPVVALAVIVQHSPLILLANRRKVPSIDALNEQRIMLLPHEAELIAYLKREGIDRYTVVPHSFELADLTGGRVDAMSGYATDEPFLLRQQRFPFIAYTPSAVGINFYGDTLFTTEQHLQSSGKSVQAFREAVLQGWNYAMAHPEEMADLILKRYSNRHSKAHLLFEANELRRLMQPELVEIGQMSATRWQQIGQTYAELGMLPADYSVAGLIYDSAPHRLPAWAWAALLLGLVLLCVAVLLAFYFARLNRRLHKEIETRQDTELALGKSEERYRRLAEQSWDVIWTLDLASMRFTYVSPAVERVRGFSPEEVMRQPVAAALTAESHAVVLALLQDHLRRLAAGDAGAVSATLEIEQPHRNGGLISSEVVASFILDEQGQPVTILGVARDISERRRNEVQLQAANERLRKQLEEIEKLQAALQEQAIRDSLTGCFNRRYLDETLERELRRACREDYPLALVILDLDHFKQINDTYGHLAGDEALQELARTLQAGIRQEDVLCRYGGEEFIVLMPGMALAVAAERAEGWRQTIAGIRLRCGDGELKFTISAGVAAYPEHGDVADELTQAADLALYLAKHEGRNRVEISTQPEA